MSGLQNHSFTPVHFELKIDCCPWIYPDIFVVVVVAFNGVTSCCVSCIWSVLSFTFGNYYLAYLPSSQSSPPLWEVERSALGVACRHFGKERDLQGKYGGLSFFHACALLLPFLAIWRSCHPHARLHGELPVLTAAAAAALCVWHMLPLHCRALIKWHSYALPAGTSQYQFSSCSSQPMPWQGKVWRGWRQTGSQQTSVAGFFFSWWKKHGGGVEERVIRWRVKEGGEGVEM